MGPSGTYLAGLSCLLKCSDGLFVDPHLFSGCGHTFCYKCIIGKIEGKGISTSQCPTCNQPGWKRDLKPVHVLANIAQPISHLLDAVGLSRPEGMQPSTGRNEARQLEAPAVSKQRRSTAAKSKACKQTSSRSRSLAGPRGVTFVGCSYDEAAAELPACSKAPGEATGEQSYNRASGRRRVSAAAAALQQPQQPNLVPDTYAELAGSQHSQGEGVKAAGRRLKRRRSGKSAEDRHFIKQFAAEVHALLGSASGHPIQAAGSSLQERSMSTEAPKTKQEQVLSQGSAMPEDSVPNEPAMGGSSAREARATAQSIAAAQGEPPTASPNDGTDPAGEQAEPEPIPETPGATRRLARSSSPAPSLARQDPEQAAGRPGEAHMGSLAGDSAEQDSEKPSPSNNKQEAPSAMVKNHSLERTQRMEAPEQVRPDTLLLGQCSGQGTGQMAGQMPSLTVEEVHALGTELCSKAARYLPARPEDAEALQGAVRSMQGILEMYACQTSGLAAGSGDALPIPESLQNSVGQSKGCWSSPRQAEADQVHLEGTLMDPACAYGATESLSAIDAALIARGVRLQSLATLS